ncbi:hypothetical protein [Streptomyces hirsutus]|uniref:hypothetical protein n=1 Tax=Streptomyces hirsutus TaxID=35620 RepID=UPI00369C5AAE
MTDQSTTVPDAIHKHFGLTYANYLVLPRTLLQSMPDAWQTRFVALLDEMTEAFEHVPQAEAYKVEAAEEHTVSEMTEAQLKAAGITEDWYAGEKPPEGLASDELTEWQNQHEQLSPDYYDADGNELDEHSRVLLPAADPVPHYNRGRTYIEPKRPAAGGLVSVTRYTVSVLPADDINHRYFALHVELKSRGWVVHNGHEFYTEAGVWEPGQATAHHFADYDDALAVARKAAPDVTVNGHTAVEAYQRTQEATRG